MTPEDDFLITMTDLRRYHCVSGIRRWFGEHNLDFRAFLEHGIMASDLLAAGDEMAERAVRLIRESRNG
jgi:hypothetical protein